jgi:hypothetical protein
MNSKLILAKRILLKQLLGFSIKWLKVQNTFKKVQKGPKKVHKLLKIVQIPLKKVHNPQKIVQNQEPPNTKSQPHPGLALKTLFYSLRRRD